MESTQNASEEITVTPDQVGVKNVVDYAVLSKVGPSCKYWKSHHNTESFEDWQCYHHCPINHTGSAGSMEASGVKQIFQRSVGEKKLRYTTYLGDGDSKSYQNVVILDPYPA